MLGQFSGLIIVLRISNTMPSHSMHQIISKYDEILRKISNSAWIGGKCVMWDFFSESFRKDFGDWLLGENRCYTTTGIIRAGHENKGGGISEFRKCWDQICQLVETRSERLHILGWRPHIRCEIPAHYHSNGGFVIFRKCLKQYLQIRHHLFFKFEFDCFDSFEKKKLSLLPLVCLTNIPKVQWYHSNLLAFPEHLNLQISWAPKIYYLQIPFGNWTWKGRYRQDIVLFYFVLQLAATRSQMRQKFVRHPNRFPLRLRYYPMFWVTALGIIQEMRRNVFVGRYLPHLWVPANS